MSGAAVLIHGFGTSARLWDQVLPLLRGEVRTLDLPGFGDSPDDRYSVDGMADAVQERLAGLENFVLVGHSMGGKVAAVLAARRPAGLSGLLLIAPSPLSPEPMTAQDRQALKAAYGHPELLTEHYRQITQQPLSADGLAQLVSDGMRGSQAAWNAWPDSGSREDRATEAGRIEVPVSVLTSEDDPVISPQVVAHHLLPSFPRAALTRLGGSGHLLPLELPAEVAAFISEKQ
ncbi:alpha/beta fold hydrolase [Deinococcus altitudinis]|uniref:alpha/beta fold hydrolase n=1 Tax=Deinococcus altitudinis TaxID=468914 RepID=UPI0038919B0E